MTAAVDHRAAIASALASCRVLRDSERELQDAVAEILSRAGIAFEREAVLADGDRIDFLIGSVGLEVKVRGGLSALTRQLARYAASERVAELVVLTTPRLACLPRSLHGKPLSAVIARAWP